MHIKSTAFGGDEELGQISSTVLDKIIMVLVRRIEEEAWAYCVVVVARRIVVRWWQR